MARSFNSTSAASFFISFSRFSCRNVRRIAAASASEGCSGNSRSALRMSERSSPKSVNSMKTARTTASMAARPSSLSPASRYTSCTSRFVRRCFSERRSSRCDSVVIRPTVPCSYACACRGFSGVLRRSMSTSMGSRDTSFGSLHTLVLWRSSTLKLEHPSNSGGSVTSGLPLSHSSSRRVSVPMAAGSVVSSLFDRSSLCKSVSCENTAAGTADRNALGRCSAFVLFACSINDVK
mmetsp:Transcript_15768/g.54809  ORF Transcript_15768/g.54809 Transcript_15768/m.54809 type:complete len:236 (-) Transcript_15768:228-935(-)